MKKTDNWLIIDEDNKIIQSYRYYGTALSDLRSLKTIYVGATLTIVSVEYYSKLGKVHQNPREPTRRQFYNESKGY